MFACDHAGMLKGKAMEEDVRDIEVSADIYKAAMAFDELVDGEGFLLAEEVEQLFRRTDKQNMIARWKAISDYLKEREFASGKARTVIVP